MIYLFIMKDFLFLPSSAVSNPPKEEILSAEDLAKRAEFYQAEADKLQTE